MRLRRRCGLLSCLLAICSARRARRQLSARRRQVGTRCTQSAVQGAPPPADNAGASRPASPCTLATCGAPVEAPERAIPEHQAGSGKHPQPRAAVQMLALVVVPTARRRDISAPSAPGRTVLQARQKRGQGQAGGRRVGRQQRRQRDVGARRKGQVLANRALQLARDPARHACRLRRVPEQPAADLRAARRRVAARPRYPAAWPGARAARAALPSRADGSGLRARCPARPGDRAAPPASRRVQPRRHRAHHRTAE